MLVLLSLRTQYSNLGDQAISAQLVARLARNHEVCCFVAGVPDWYRREFERSLAQANIRVRMIEGYAGLALAILGAVLRSMKVCFFLSPGAMIPQPGLGAQRLLQLMLLRVVPRIRFAQVGASYHGLDRHGERLLRAAASRPNHLSVRDAHSQHLLAQKGIDVPLVPDLAFGLPRTQGAGRRFVLSFRIGPGEAVGQLAERLKPLVDAAMSDGMEPCLYWQVLSDREPSRQLSALLGVPLLRDSDARPDLAEALAFYANAAMICSNRLHALLIGSAAGALPLALLNDDERKVLGVFQEAGLENFVTSRRSTDVERFREISSVADAGARVDKAFAKANAALASYFATLAEAGQ